MNPFSKILGIVVDEAGRNHKTGDDKPAVSGQEVVEKSHELRGRGFGKIGDNVLDLTKSEAPQTSA